MKKGISLIVLVITIIVMIIIAGAIIISLSNSNVVAKANLGKLTNDKGSMSDLATTRMAEYSVMNEGALAANIFASQTALTAPLVSVPALTAVTALSFPSSGTAKGTWSVLPSTTDVILSTTVVSTSNATTDNTALATLLGITTTDVTANPWIRCVGGKSAGTP